MNTTYTISSAESVGSNSDTFTDIIAAYTTQKPYVYVSIVSLSILILCMVTCCICCMVAYKERRKNKHRRDSVPEPYQINVTVTGHSTGKHKHSLQILPTLKPGAMQKVTTASPQTSPPSHPRPHANQEKLRSDEEHGLQDDQNHQNHQNLHKEKDITTDLLHCGSPMSTEYEYTHEWYEGTLTLEQQRALAPQKGTFVVDHVARILHPCDSERDAEVSTTEDLRMQIEEKLRNAQNKQQLKAMSQALDALQETDSFYD